MPTHRNLQRHYVLPSYRLKMAETELYDRKTRALLDTDIMSEALFQKLFLVPEAMNRRITVADGKAARVLGEVKTIRNILAQLTVWLSFLVFSGVDFELIIGAPAMETLGENIDLRGQMVTFKISDGSIGASLLLLNEGVE